LNNTWGVACIAIFFAILIASNSTITSRTNDLPSESHALLEILTQYFADTFPHDHTEKDKKKGNLHISTI